MLNLIIALIAIVLFWMVLDRLGGDAQLINIIKIVCILMVLIWLLGGYAGWHSLRF